MNCHTKFARLSRQAMTSQHGRLLQDSGFTKRGSTQKQSEDSEHTSMLQQVAWYCPYETVRTGRLSSGRPAIQSIRRAGRSTLARQFLEIASMYSIEERLDALRSALQKTYFPPSRSESLELLTATQFVALRSDSTPSPSLYDSLLPLYSGSIQMQQAKRRELQSLSSLGWSGLFPSP